MNDTELENSLRTLVPRAPSDALEGRIAADLSAPPLEERAPVGKARAPVNILFKPAGEPLLVRCFRSLGWAFAGAASAVAAIALFPVGSVPASSEPAPERAAAAADAIAASSTSAAGGAANTPAAETANDFSSAETTRELLASEEGDTVLYADDNSPVHQVRYRYRERQAWTDSRTGARMEIEVPRQDVFLVPVSMQ